jgi:TPR repeat protein
LKYAILIGNALFPKDDKIAQLRCPPDDVNDLREILTGGTAPYEVIPLIDKTHTELEGVLYEILNKTARKDDQVLIYFSGHGKLDHGDLFLACLDTHLDRLPVTALAIDTIGRLMRNSSSRRLILILDCCYSGAVDRIFSKGDTSNQVQASLPRQLGGTGTYILTASTDVQVAEEKEGDRNSLLTKHLLAGARNGVADTDADGIVTMDEVLSFVQTEVAKEGRQEPLGFAIGVGKGKLEFVTVSNGGPISELRRFARSLNAALNDDIVGMVQVGDAYLAGRGTQRDREQGLKWLGDAAKKGDIEAMLKLAAALRESYNVENQAEGETWIRRAADAGSTAGMIEIAELSWKKEDKATAIEWYKRAAGLGDTAAMRILARSLACRHKGVFEEWPDESREWLVKAAELGDSWAMFDLGNAHLQFNLAPSDSKAAAVWFERAADAGNTEAMLALSKMCCGNRDFLDHNAGVKWLQRAAATPDDDGRHLKAMRYLSKEYLFWAEFAMESGPQLDPLSGQLLASNELARQARAWLEKAVALNDTEAMLELSLWYRDGRAGPQDIAKAFELVTRAAELGDGQAREWASFGWVGAMKRKALPESQT